MSELKLTGMAELTERLRKLPAELSDRAVKTAARKAANLVRDEMELRAPMDTGALAMNLKTRVRQTGPEQIVAEVGPSKNEFYGMFIEFGTRNIPARPFMGPALDATAQEAVNLFTDELRKAIGRMERKR